MNKRLNKKRLAILTALGDITTLRQGSLTEQYITKGKGTNRRRLGPYYLRTWYEDGVKHTEHIPADQAEQMQSLIKQYQKAKALFDDFLDVTEEMTLSRSQNTESRSRNNPVDPVNPVKNSKKERKTKHK